MMTKLYKRLPLFIWLLLALFLARAFIYAYYVPPWQGPDEPQHYDYIHSLQIEKSLPVLGEVTLCNKVRSSLNSFYFNPYTREKNPYAGKKNLDTTESFTGKIQHFDSRDLNEEAPAITAQRNQIVQHPPLYYILGAVITWPFKNGSLLNSIFLLRMMSALFGLGVVLFTYLGFSLLFSEKSYAAYGATAFVALNPMFAHVSTIINNDSLANFLFAVFIYLFIKSAKKGLDVRMAVSLGVVVGLGLLTKFFFVIALPLMILAFIFLRGTMSKNALASTVSVIMPIFISAMIYIRNVVLYGALQPIYRFRTLDNSTFQNMSIFSYVLSTEFTKKFIISFWSNFGWIKPRFPMFYYKFATLIVAIALIGFVAYMTILAFRKDMLKFKLLALLSLGPASLIAAISLNSFKLARISGVIEGVQGRYLFSFIGVIGLVLFLGIRQLLPFKNGHVALVVFISGLVVLDISAIFYHILPYFYF